jgi:hypothetical protein
VLALWDRGRAPLVDVPDAEVVVAAAEPAVN